MKSQIERIQKASPHNLTYDIIRQRLNRGWSEERVINTPPGFIAKPAKDHPLKRASYERMLQRKLRKHRKTENAAASR